MTWKRHANAGTVKRSRLECPNPDCDGSTPITGIRGDQRGELYTRGRPGAGRRYGLRQWENDDLVPRPDDVFQERLYCVRWRLPSLDALLRAEQDCALIPARRRRGRDDPTGLAGPRPRHCRLGRIPGRRRANGRSLNCANAVGAKTTTHGCKPLRERFRRQLYRSVDEADLEREAHALALLLERFAEWQTLGFIPSRAITPGYNTDQPIRERGWTHWHHLFTPRQLLTHRTDYGRRSSFYIHVARRGQGGTACSGLGSCRRLELANCAGGIRARPYETRLPNRHSVIRHSTRSRYFCWQRLHRRLTQAFHGNLVATAEMRVRRFKATDGRHADARMIEKQGDVWITDPPYADAINYHELSEYFLVWYGKQLLAQTLPELVRRQQARPRCPGGRPRTSAAAW